jgi:hypothetical protein
MITMLAAGAAAIDARCPNDPTYSRRSYYGDAWGRELTLVRVRVVGV